MSSDLEPLLTTRELAKAIRRSPNLITRMVKHDGLPCVRIGKREPLFRVSRVQAWLERWERGLTAAREAPPMVAANRQRAMFRR